MLFYLPMAFIAYWVYGDYLLGASEIFSVLTSEAHGGVWGAPVIGAALVFAGHVLTTLPILCVPLMTRLERLLVQQRYTYSLNEEEAIRPHVSLLQRVLIRVPTLALLLLVALFFPYFEEMIGLGTSLSISCDAFLFPAALSWRLNPPADWRRRLLLVSLALFGLGVAGAGMYGSLRRLMLRLEEEQPWQNMFTITCSQPGP